MSGNQTAILWLIVLLGSGTPGVSAAGTLSATYALVPTNSIINLTAHGSLDWVHWGLNTEFGYDGKAVAPTPIMILPLIVPQGGLGPYQYADNFNGYSWSDGAPNTFATNTTTGIYTLGNNSGFQLSVPADTVPRRLEVYVGAFGAQGQFNAALSDSSAPAYGDSSVDNDTNGPSSVYTLVYSADTPGQALTVTFVLKHQHDNRTGNVTLEAAALSYAFSNNPPSATLTSPSANSVFTAPANVPLAALASDSDGTISKVEYFQGSTKLGQATNPNYAFVWNNAPAGDFLLRAVATDNSGLSCTSKPVEIFINTNGGSLSGSVAAVAPELDLTAAGNLDWAHWGLGTNTGFDHKSGVAPQISAAVLGTNVLQQLTDYPTTFDWSDGTPTAFGGTDTGVFIIGLGNGFELTVPAANSTRTLQLCLGLFAGQGTLQAFLSNFSAPAYVDTSLSNLYADAAAAYTFNFSATAPNQTLHVRFTGQTLYDLSFGNVTLEAATLSGYLPPPLVLLNPGWGPGGFTFTFNTETDRTYTVAYKDSPSLGTWQAFTNVTGDGALARITDASAHGNARFYRVSSP